MRTSSVLLLLVTLGSLAAFAAATPAAQLPRPTGYVSDFANVLAPSERAYLEQVAVELERNTTAELAIVTVPTLEGEPIEQYSIELADAWKVGKAGKDNGVILLLAPNEREVRIEVGYGLEGALTDVQSSRIIREKMAPYLSNDEWFAGLRAGAEAIAAIVVADAPTGTLTPDQAAQAGQGNPQDMLVFIVGWTVLCSIIFGVIYYASRDAKPPVKWRKTLGYTYAASAALGLALAFLGSFFAIFFALVVFFHIFALAFSMPPQGGGKGGTWRSSWGGWGMSSGGWSSGGGGGGFGGFGGGGFGGGGAGGRF